MKRFSEETVRQAIRDIEDEAYEKFGRDVEIIVDGYNVIFDDDDIADPVYAKVNWAATGSQKPEDAEAFANKILEAVEMAKAFPYNGAVLRAEGDDEEGYVFWYEMKDEQEQEERRAYSRGELEAFLNWEEDEYDIDGIMAEVTSIDPLTGDRYWVPEFVDDDGKLFDVCMRYHKDEDDGMPIIPDDGPKDFWDMIMEREKADMEAFEQMKRERAIREMTRDLQGYETGMTAEDIAVRWPE